jgi:uncharacterized protein (DUF697 family)
LEIKYTIIPIILPKIGKLKKLSAIIIVISIIAGIISVLAGTELGQVSVQNMINAASNGNDTRGGNTTTSITQTGSALEEKIGVIASAPKCLGSALCPD